MANKKFLKTNKQLPTKWVDLKRFKKSRESIIEGKRITTFYKPLKPDQWYFKPKINELEAAASDFYRFILGKARAAKSQVVYRKPHLLGIISQHNPAGFETMSSLKASLGKKTHTPNLDLSDENEVRNAFVEYGSGEVDVVEKFIDDIDGLGNPGNVGLNHRDELSRIDYGLAFYGSRRTWKNADRNEILQVFTTDELLVNKTNNDIAIKRFYQAQLKIQLLNETIINTILKRHLEYDSLHSFFSAQGNKYKNGKSIIIENVLTLRQILLQSNKFQAFMRDFDPKELFAECEEFFKHEKKAFPVRYHNCLIALKETYFQIKEMSLSNNHVSQRLSI